MSLDEQIDQLCDKFEAAWTAGKQPKIRNVLAKIPAKHHAAVLEQLIPVEVECRIIAGQQTSASDYAEFGPSAVERATKAIEKVRATISSKAAEDFNRLTESQMLDRFQKVSQPQTTSPVIGPYKILQKIDEGGMGIVFMAEQTHPVRRRVALKLIKSDLNDQQIIVRFEAERQALALMDHANIAKVLDAGTTNDGTHF